MIKETFVPVNAIKGLETFEGYFVSDFGNVISFNKDAKNGKILKPNFTKGYHNVTLQKKSIIKKMFVHRLVALAFIPNPENKPQVNHLDENKLNNHVSNLSWVTSSENNNYGSRTEKASETKTNGALSHAIYGIHTETEERIEFPSHREAERQGFTRSGIYYCINGKFKTHKGYKWYKA